MNSIQKRCFIAVSLSLLILVSSVGWSSYARYCSCAEKVYTSLFANNESDCCQAHKAQKEVTTTEHSCCSKKQVQEEYCQKKDNCCNTKVKYMALDTDATLVQVSIDIPNVLTDWNFTGLPNLAHIDFIASYNLATLYKKSFLPNAPPPISGRQLLQLIQVMRC